MLGFRLPSRMLPKISCHPRHWQISKVETALRRLLTGMRQWPPRLFWEDTYQTRPIGRCITILGPAIPWSLGEILKPNSSSLQLSRFFLTLDHSMTHRRKSIPTSTFLGIHRHEYNEHTESVPDDVVPAGCRFVCRSSRSPG